MFRSTQTEKKSLKVTVFGVLLQKSTQRREGINMFLQICAPQEKDQYSLTN